MTGHQIANRMTARSKALRWLFVILLMRALQGTAEGAMEEIQTILLRLRD